MTVARARVMVGVFMAILRAVVKCSKEKPPVID